MVHHGVAADPDDFDALLDELVHGVAEALGLVGAAGREVAGVEVDHEVLLADVVGRFPGFPLVVEALEGRRDVADLEVGRAAWGIGLRVVGAAGGIAGRRQQTQDPSQQGHASQSVHDHSSPMKL